MANKEVRLVVRLKDAFSKDAKILINSIEKVNKTLSVFGRISGVAAKNFSTMSRNVRRAATDTTALAGGLGLMLGDAGKKVYDLEDTLNEIVGRRFGKDLVMMLQDGSELGKDQFRKSVRDLIATIDKELPRTALQIAKAYNQLVQAGMNHEQVEGILPTAVEYAIAGNYGTEEAADRMTNIMTAMRLPMATYEQAAESARRVADTLAYAANITNSNMHEMTEAFKYAAPIASALGINIEQLAGMFAVMARSGIKGSEAGVALRSMLVRLVRPTKAGVAELAKVGINLQDYLAESDPISVEDIKTSLSLGGINFQGGDEAIAKALADDIGLAEKVQRITDLVAAQVGGSAVDRNLIAEMLTDQLFANAESLDIERLIADMQKANIPAAAFFRIFDVRQGARGKTLFNEDVSAFIEQITEKAKGFSQALSAERMEGFVGSVQRFNSAITRLYVTIAQSGVLDTITTALTKAVELIDRIGEANPKLLEFGTYAAMGLVAAVPLGLAVAGLTSIMAALGSTLAFLLTPLGAVVAGLGYLAVVNFQPILTFLKGFGQGVSENLGPRTQSLIDQVIAKFSELGEVTKMGEAGKARDGYSWGEWVANGLEETIVSVETSWTRFEAAWNKIIAWRNGVEADIRSGFQWLTDGSSDQWLADKFKAIPGLLKDAWDGIMNSEVVTKFGQAGAAIWKGLSGIAVDFYNAGVSMVQSIWDGAVAKFDEFVAWLQGIPGRILGAVGSIDLSSVFNIGGTGGTGGPGHSPISLGAGVPASGIPEKTQNVINSGGNSVSFNNVFNVEGSGDEAVKRMADYLKGQLDRSAQTAFSGTKNYGDY